MAKKPKPKMARVAPVQKVNPTAVVEQEPLRPVPVALVMEERDALARIFASPVFTKAFRNARCMKPTAFVAAYSAARGAQDANQIANDRLREIRGWEAFEFALLAQTDEPKQKVQPVTESFPAGGTMDAAFREQAAKSVSHVQPPKPKQI